MTVGGSGNHGGDPDGDLATPSPAREFSSGLLGGSRFWLLQASDDEEDDGEVELSPGVADSNGSLRYLCCTPTPANSIDIVDDSRDLARRARKRLEKRDAQRQATKASLLFESMEGTLISSPLPSARMSVKSRTLVRPVMEPSVFRDDNDGVWTVVRRRHRPPAITGNVHDSKKSNRTKCSDIPGVGLARLRVSPTKYQAHGNIAVPRTLALQRGREKVDLGPRQARVGGVNAGHAFRKLLGFVWRKKEPGEPVWRRHVSPLRMNGEGGRGGFNPGRGAFNAGRGGFQGRPGYQGRGYQGRGGFQGRHGFQGRGNVMPRGRQGPGRGGHQAYQGTSNPSGLGSGSNFVQGESSNMGAMNNGNQRQPWRNEGYVAGNNGGFGAHQQRWQGDRGHQYRPRDNNMQSRSAIDADLLHQTVQAVVAAVTAATKVSEQAPVAPVATEGTGGAGQPATASVAMSDAAPNAMQEGHENTGAVTKPVDGAGQGPQKKKKEEKTGCFRCKQPGHHLDDCPTPFCDLCESVHHATHACHLHQAPKPTAILHGYANEALMFFELACGAFKAKVENPRLAKITVQGDVMTIPELIDQLKKIVPSEKFNWEVYHFKENVYRVKLPSKQEVQRLKNLGTYICNDRESLLAFDIWSSLEEPMYMLPEVWVRVTGVPTDIISDYLSLWGVGTLFGKTLDVDMAFTRKHKVEGEDENHEVDMDEVNNDGDGNDDASNGEHNKEGGNAMDMDPKGKDGANNSTIGGQDGAFMSDGIQGMQLAQKEINIGAMKVPLSPAGESAWGLPQVFSGSAFRSGSAVVAERQQVLPASGPVVPAEGLRANEPVKDTCEQVDTSAVEGGSTVATEPVLTETGSSTLAQTICMQDRPVSGLSPLHHTPEQTKGHGSSTPERRTLRAHTEERPQRIMTAISAREQKLSINHWTDADQLLHLDATVRGSSVHGAPVASGTVGDCSSMGNGVLTKQNNGEEFNIHGGDGNLNSNEPNRFGIALPDRNIVNPTVEEVIAFGGIPKPSSGIRSSSRLGQQRDGDMPQLDRAMKRAQLRDAPPNTGYSHDGSLGSTMGSPFAGGAGCHGYWMHTAPDGRSGYLVPGWLASY
ncbi:hypothetical protein QYE76_034735 [Lolium multiflorum]|uniref:CCHC-type domain-containing protein n=1 Tax=Lolium multiflorum TaxID=4521 RepID=A0AAD8QYM3_LOLMU|nr:hypothetical protein QYE76_034735 [Lolium multiflorum]